MVEMNATFGDGWLEVDFEEGLFPKDVVYGSAFVFIDRCFVHLDRAAGRTTVRLRGKTGALDDGPALFGELENELRGQAWRKQIADENAQLLRDIDAQAFGTASAEPALDDLLSAEGADAFDDPLGIAMSWEEKYLKKTPAKDETSEGAAAGSSAATDASTVTAGAATEAHAKGPSDSAT